MDDNTPNKNYIPSSVRSSVEDPFDVNLGDDDKSIVAKGKSAVESKATQRKRQALDAGRLDSQTSAGNYRAQNHKKWPVSWGKILLLILLIALVGVAVAYLFLKKDSTLPKAKSSEVVSYYNVSEGYQLSPQNLSAQDVQKARHVALQFLNSPDVKEASKYILGDHELYKSYHRALPKSQARFSLIKANRYEGGARSAVFSLQLPQSPSIEIHTFAHPEGEFRVDWRALNLLEGGSQLGDLKQVNGVSPVKVKAYLSTGGKYTEQFPAAEYQSLVLRDYAGGIQITAYIKRGSEGSEQLGEAMLTTTEMLGERLMLRAVVTVSPQNGAWILDAVHAVDWTNLSTYR